MRLRLIVVLPVLSCFLLTGCGDKAELTEFGYAQAVAIDQAKDGKFELTTHFYNPTSGGETGTADAQRKRGFNITTRADTVFEAARDIPIHFGRKAKWDHMRIILIGEEIARKEDVGDVLDFFSRDHEPRATVLTLITKGKASDYLNVKPFIENTIGQQLRKIEESAIHYSAKTMSTPLLELAIQLKNETGIAMIPYVYSSSIDNPKELTVAGVAMLKKGKLNGSIVTPTDTQRLLMLIDKYEGGVIEIPCNGMSEEKQKAKESLEVLSLKTKVTPTVKDDEVTVRVMTRIKGSVGELRCSSLKTKDEALRFRDTVKKTVESELREVVKYFQKRQMDAFGIGDQIYRMNPSLWKSMKPDWGERFASSRFEINVEVDILNTGMGVGTPFSK